MAILNAGRVPQVGAPLKLYDRPVDHFVAAFIGRTNFLHGVVTAGGIDVQPHGTIAARPSALADGTEAYLAIRPETARLLRADETAGPDDVVLPAIVEAVAFVGSQVHTHLRLDVSDAAFVVTSNERHRLPAPGDSVRVTWSVDDARILSG